MKLEFSTQEFEKYSDMKFHENTSGGIRVVFVRTDDRRDEDSIRFSQICYARPITDTD